MQNYLLSIDSNSLVDFAKVKIEDFKPAIKELIAKEEYLLGVALQKTEFTYEDIFGPSTELQYVISILSNLVGVNFTDELQSVYDECMEMYQEYINKVSYNKDLYNAVVYIRDNAELDKLQKKQIDDFIEAAEDNGINFEPEVQNKVNRIRIEMMKSSNDYSANTVKSRAAWTKLYTREELAGVEEDMLAQFSKAASDKGLDGYLVDLSPTSVAEVLRKADNEKVRKEVFEASNEIASSGEFCNTDNIGSILTCRKALADIFGYANYAEMSIRKKMAKTPQNTFDMMNKLAEVVADKATAEVKELYEFAKTKGYQRKEMRAWNSSYYSNIQVFEKYNVDVSEVEKYFNIDFVLSHLFGVANKMYGIDVTYNPEVSVWHETVKYYDVFKDGNLIAGFYLDPYSRPSKRAGAWMDPLIQRNFTFGKRVKPVAVLVLNQRDNGKMSIDNIETLFHEFGHGLHHMLTTVDMPGYSGTNVQWDAVELPSQFMENYVWDKEQLKLMSKHEVTGDQISDELVANLLNYKSYMASSALRGQLWFSLSDMTIHTSNVTTASECKDIFMKIRGDLKFESMEEYYANRVYSFLHIFGGGYAAGYYSYLWAEVMSSDVFEKFKEEGIFDKAVCDKFLNTILSQGSVEDFDVLYENFMGRNPDPEALLYNRGVLSK